MQGFLPCDAVRAELLAALEIPDRVPGFPAEDTVRAAGQETQGNQGLLQ